MRIRGSGSASPAGAEFLVYRSKLEAGVKKGSSIHASSAYRMQSRSYALSESEFGMHSFCRRPGRSRAQGRFGSISVTPLSMRSNSIRRPQLYWLRQQPPSRRRARAAVDCTAAQTVAAALLASGTGDTVMASGPRPRLRNSASSAHCSKCSALA